MRAAELVGLACCACPCRCVCDLPRSSLTDLCHALRTSCHDRLAYDWREFMEGAPDFETDDELFQRWRLHHTRLSSLKLEGGSTLADIESDLKVSLMESQMAAKKAKIHSKKEYMRWLRE